MTREEFMAKRKALVRRSNKGAALWLVVFFAMLLGCIPLTRFIERHADHPWLIPVGGGAVFVLLLVNLTLINWFAGQEQRCVVAPCPHCGKPLAGISAQIALATDNCGHCGKRVFEPVHG